MAFIVFVPPLTVSLVDMENWMEKYKLNESLMILSMLLAFLILAVFGQRKTWIATESLMMCVSGLAFIVFPKQILSIETIGQMTNVEVDLARFFGLTLLCNGLIWLITRETRDGTIVIAVLQSRAFTSLCLVILQSIVFFGTKSLLITKTSNGSKQLNFSNQMFFLGILPTFLWFLGNLLHLAKSFDFNSFPQHNICLNNHLKLEAMLVFALGIAFIAFPSQILQYLFKMSGNKVSLHLVRSVGSLYIGSSMNTLLAPGFLHERDKRAVLLIHIVTYSLQLGYWYFWLFLGESNLFCPGIVFLPLLGNAFVGYFWGGTNVYKPNSAEVVEPGRELFKVD